MINITEIDKQSLQDVDWHYEGQQHDYLLQLLNTSSFEERTVKGLEIEINDTLGMDKDKYDAILFKLYNNQMDRITSGLNYSQTDILKHLRKL